MEWQENKIIWVIYLSNVCLCMISTRFTGDKIHFIKSPPTRYNRCDQLINTLTQSPIRTRGIQPFNKITIKIVSLLIGFNNYTASQRRCISFMSARQKNQSGLSVCRHFWPMLLRHRTTISATASPSNKIGSHLLRFSNGR